MRILIAGDFSPKYTAKESILNNPYVLDSIKELCSEVDYAIVNLECPIIENAKQEVALDKCGPHLWNTPNVLDVLKDVGFNTFTLANNHIKDYSDNGVRQTLAYLNERELFFVGAGINLDEARRPLYLKGEPPLCVINCCESEYSIATKNSAGANPINVIETFNAIKEAKTKGNRIIVITHSGIEGYNLPTPRMQQNYRFFIDAGADIVVNHHQHCFSGFESYNRGMIFYGLGNFYFDSIKPNESWCQGYIVKIEIDGDVRYKIIPYIQCGEKDNELSLLSLEEQHSFWSRLKGLNEIIVNPAEVINQFEKYADNHEMDYADSFSPLNNRLFNYLHRKGIIPDCLSHKRILYLRDMFTCESHYDRYLRMINNKLSEE